MSNLWYIWLILDLLFIEARYIRLPSVNTSELSPIGTSIIQLIDVLPTSNWEFQFQLQQSYFLLDNLKGTIIIKRYLDREQLCQSNYCSCLNQCLIKLEINAISDFYTHILSLPILIQDENDNSCYFLNEIYYFNISENIRSNTRFILPLAYDPDLSPNNIQSYALLENNYTEYFRLENQLIPSMIVMKQLDRELIERYDFNLCAYEGVDEQKRSCCTKIVLTVIDINDNSPIFEHNQQVPFIVNVSESILIHTEIIQMKAFDFDQGLNGQIQYTFSKWTLNDPINSEIFYIHPSNGSIILLKQLDYEKRTSYELQVQAKDLGENSIPTYATVIIQVVDENDCLPELFIFSSPDVQLINNSMIYIYENITINTSIIYLTISDCDTNQNGHVSIELSSSNSIIKLEKMSNYTYTLLTNENLDREKQAFYTFSLILYDHGQPRHSLVHKFDLYLMDINDCFPYFDRKTEYYSFNLDENNPENFLLETIRVYDLDENDQIALDLEFPNQKDKDLFLLNQQNQLIITKTLDYEDQSFYNFTLTAKDLAGHRTSILVKIYLNDVNDNPVEFSRNFTQIFVEENQPIGTLVGQTQAKDNDKTDQILYYIHPNDADLMKNFIELNPNGNLYTKTRFHHQKFQFHIIANDSLHTDTILTEIVINKKSILITPSPYCVAEKKNRTIEIQLENSKNLSFYLRNSSKDLILYPNGTLFIQPNAKKYTFDIYFSDGNSFSIFKNFILLIESDCKYEFFIHFNHQLIFICILCLLILFIIIVFYIQQLISNKILEKKLHLTSSFTSIFSPPSSLQFTPMTIISSSIHEQTNQSSSLSNSSSSTYIKMSHSFEDDVI